MKLQEKPNGPITVELFNEIMDFKDKNGYSWEKVGHLLGFSASFTRNICVNRENADGIRNISVSSVKKLYQNLLIHHHHEGETAQTSNQKLLSEASLEDLGQRAEQLGYRVSFEKR